MSKPRHEVNSKKRHFLSSSVAGSTGNFDHQQLLQNTRGGHTKHMHTEDALDRESKRDIASEIDYSDHKSIASSVALSKRYTPKRHSDTHSVLSKVNLTKLENENPKKQISKLKPEIGTNPTLNL